jgi:hypothetical protein
MTRTSTLIALAAASALLTPVVVHATGAAPKAPVEKVASAAAPVAASMAESAPAACARKVKVVYAGYGETHAMACAAR